MDPTKQALEEAINNYEQAHKGDATYEKVCHDLRAALGESAGPPSPGHEAAQQVAHQAPPHQPPQASPGHQAAVAAVEASKRPPAFAKKPVEGEQPQEPPKGFQQAQAQALQRVKGKKKSAA